MIDQVDRLRSLAFGMEEPLAAIENVAAALELISTSEMVDDKTRAALCALSDQLRPAVGAVNGIWRDMCEKPEEQPRHRAA